MQAMDFKKEELSEKEKRNINILDILRRRGPVSRPDIEGRSSRLLASVDNQAAEAAEGDKRRTLAARADQYATHAAGLLAESFAWGEQAFALEERGDAHRLQGHRRAAMSDYALAIPDEGERAALVWYVMSLRRDRGFVARLLRRTTPWR